MVEQISDEVKAKYMGRYAKSVETGWIGKVIDVEPDHNCPQFAMLKMVGVNGWSRLLKAGDLEKSLDHDDVQYFDVNDVKFLTVSNDERGLIGNFSL